MPVAACGRLPFAVMNEDAEVIAALTVRENPLVRCVEWIDAVGGDIEQSARADSERADGRTGGEIEQRFRDAGLLCGKTLGIG